MAPRVTINADFKAVIADVDKQVRFATAVALTRTGQAIKEELVKEMERVFDRPTPYTMNSLQLRPATKDNLEAIIDFKEFGGTPAWKFLGPQIEGGGRNVKRFERALQSAGLLPKGMYAAPGPAADIDRYGNMVAGQIVKILSALRASSDPTQNRGQAKGRGTRRDEEYFVGGVGRSGHLKPGVYRRMPGGRISMVIRYIRAPSYRQRYDFYGVADRVANARFEAEFAKAFQQAMATAR